MTQVLTLVADALRLGGVVSLALAVMFHDGIAVALFALVLLGLLVPRLLRVPPALDVVNGVAVLVAAWSAVLDVYDEVRWWDLVVHAVCTGALAAVASFLLARRGRGPDGGPDRGPVVAARRTAAVGLALGLVWELGEWAGHTFLDPEIFIDPADTLSDLVAGVLGAAAAGAFSAAQERAPHSENVSTTYSACVAGQPENRRDILAGGDVRSPGDPLPQHPRKDLHGR